jgi:hypothetical protein
MTETRIFSVGWSHWFGTYHSWYVREVYKKRPDGDLRDLRIGASAEQIISPTTAT